MGVFTKDDTKIVKGIAIILMLWHHLCFTQRLPDDAMISLCGNYTILLGQLLGNICISIFMFVGGYGTYTQYKNGTLKLGQKIKRLYFSYWKIFCIFVPIGFLFFRHQIDYCSDISICHIFDNISFTRILVNFFGIYTDINPEHWFFYSYVVVLLTFPVIRRILEKNHFQVNFFIVVAYFILIQWVFPEIGVMTTPSLKDNILYKRFVMQETPWAAVFWMGCAMAKDNILASLRVKLQSITKSNTFIKCVLLLLLFCIRIFDKKNYLEIFLVPLVVILIADIINAWKLIKKLTIYLSKYSTDMWLIHSYLCFYFYKIALIVIAPRYHLLIVIWLVILTLLVSIGVEEWYTFLVKTMNNLISKISLFKFL